MPIYIDDIPLRELGFIGDRRVQAALEAICREAGNSPVSSRNCWKYVIKHLAPLLPLEHREAFDSRDDTDWDTLNIAYIDLAGRSMGTDHMLMSMATVVKILFRHTTRPPREEKAFAPLEVAYFHQMSNCIRQHGLPESESRQERHPDVFKFCILCWRTTVPNRLFCAEHGSFAGVGSTTVTGLVGKEASTYQARKKQAVRQQPQFVSLIREMTTKEVLEFHNSSFNADVLFPATGRCEWLIRRRPAVWGLLEGARVPLNDENLVENFLSLFHDSSRQVGQVRLGYEAVNSTLIEMPELIWPMVLRAEAWHQVREHVVQKRGGFRKNAGRRKKAA